MAVYINNYGHGVNGGFSSLNGATEVEAEEEWT
jgi:hypothetical protein